MVFLSLALLFAAAEPPPPRDQFPETTPSHVFLVVDVETGETVREDDPVASFGERFPLGDAARPVLVLAGLESGDLHPLDTVACDSTCWAAGAHLEVDHVRALAWSCDTFFAWLEREVPRATVRHHAARAGFRGEPEGAELLAPATVTEVVAFWRALGGGTLPVQSRTTAGVLTAGETAVSSPRGIARLLHDPRLPARAVVGAAGEGAWIAGVKQIGAGRRWAFALYVRTGTASLAAARAAHLLQETTRVVRESTQARGGEPWPMDE